MSYEAEYRRWRGDPAAYWQQAAAAIDWSSEPQTIFNPATGALGRWFEGGMLNTCHNALDRHLATRAEQDALIYDSAMTGEIRRYSYAELTDATARVAGMLVRQGVGAGDRVIIYMPMVPEAVMAMLACARIGAIHSVVFGGFAARELAIRIDDAKPSLLLTASCGLEPGRVVEYKPLVDRALELASHKPARCVVLQRPMAQASVIEGRDLDWEAALVDAQPHACVRVAATDPAYILYTSGTTGKPKGVVRDTGGHAVALAWSMSHIYDTGPGEVFWAASDIGWVVGHSYIVYAPLLVGATTVLFEGKPVGTPDAATFWRVVDRHRVKTLFTAPTAIRAIKREDAAGALLEQFDTSSLKALFLAGERADPDTVAWSADMLKVPVIDHWWQTETGWPIAANCLGIEQLPAKPGSAARPVPGYDVRILDETGQPLPPGTTGAVAIRLPLPPGCAPTLWHNEEGYHAAYLANFPGYYDTGDGGQIDEDGYVWVMGRTDDVINVAGHRLSTGEMEEVLAGHGDVAECAVIGVPDALKGEVPVGLVVLKQGRGDRDGALQAELVAAVRDQVGPVAAFKISIVVERLPKTRSGKILRKTLRQLAAGKPVQVPPTIDDPAILDEIRAILPVFDHAG
ncbi:propionyl-CoA synthetase [Erythrobacter sp. Dej080120_24]|uniref:propionyl-CoA synthetase n=1 Tax=Erythrobacter sp. Dej080120_24 TaxID=3024837 RepID=UPI00291FDFDB|nr:propionyl-CoA synthetase [Erythrobacter sp. Dej080120_24]